MRVRSAIYPVIAPLHTLQLLLQFSRYIADYEIIVQIANPVRHHRNRDAHEREHIHLALAIYGLTLRAARSALL